MRIFLTFAAIVATIFAMVSAAPLELVKPSQFASHDTTLVGTANKASTLLEVSQLQGTIAGTVDALAGGDKDATSIVQKALSGSVAGI